MPVAEVRHPCVCQLPPERMPTRPETTKYTPTPATTTQIVMRAGVILFLSSPDPPPRRLIRTGYPPPTIAAGSRGACIADLELVRDSGGEEAGGWEDEAGACGLMMCGDGGVFAGSAAELATRTAEV